MPTNYKNNAAALFLYWTLAAIRAMKTFLNIIILLFLCSCSNDPSYEITHDGIKSSKPVQDGFELLEIFVSKFNEGRPHKFTHGQSFFCGPTNRFSGYLGEDVYSQNEKKIIEINQRKMDTIMSLNGNSIGGEGHDIRILEYIESKIIIDSIVHENFPFEPQREIEFYMRSENYKWVYTTENENGFRFYNYSKGLHDKLPTELKKNQWYLLNFSNVSNIIDQVFFRININGEVEQYEYYKVIMGV